MKPGGSSMNVAIPHAVRSIRVLLVLAAVGCIVAAAPAFGALIHEDMKLLAADGAAGDEFGGSVAVSANRVAVGAPGDEGGQGAAYLFDAPTGAELHKLVPADGAAGDGFGRSIAMAGGIVAVGAPGDDGGRGAAYLFDAATGGQLLKLVPDDPQAGDEFGNAMDIDGGIVVGGAWRADEFGDGSGAAYLFDASTGDQLDKLLPDAGGNYQTFGVSVAVDDGVVAVGARTFFVLGDGFTFARAYVFDAGTGNQTHVLSPDIENYNNDQGGHFADCLDIDGGLVAVGAKNRSIFYDHSGAAYVFDAATGQQLHFIYPADGHDRDHFGQSISIEGGLLAIGANEDDDSAWSAGSAYLYDASDATLIDKLLVSDGAEFDNFGTSIATEGGLVACGAIGFGGSGTQTGYVALYGAGSPTDVASELPLMGRALRHAHPNPFNPETTLRYELSEPGDVRLEIYDASGRRLAILVDGYRSDGEHRVAWRGVDDAGRALPSGVYFARLEAAGRTESTKLVMAK